MSNDFDKLKERVEAAGGQIEWDHRSTDDKYYINIDGICRYIDPEDSALLQLWNGYLDGRDAQSKARRLAKRYEREAMSMQNQPGVNTQTQSKINERLDFAAEIRNEFGIEEEPK